MDITLDIDKHEILRDIRDRGRAEGRAEGFAAVLRARFGSVPRWAMDRIAKATPAQIERWRQRLFTADSLEGVLGRKRPN